GSGAPQSDRQLLEPRQVLQIFQTENLHERRRGPIEQRAAQPFAARHDLDQTTLHQLVHDGAGIDAANLIDFEAPDRLAIRDNGQRFERGGRQAPWPQSELRFASSSSAINVERTSTSVAWGPTASDQLNVLCFSSNARIRAVAPSTSSGRGTTRCSIGSGIRAITRSAAARRSFKSICRG